MPARSRPPRGVVKKIILMRQIPAGLYAYAKTMGFVEMAHRDEGVGEGPS